MLKLVVIANNFPTPEMPADGMFVARQLAALREIDVVAEVIRVVPLLPPVKERWRAMSNVPSRYDFEGVTVHALRGLMLPKGHGTEWLGFQLRRHVRRLVAELHPDIIHVHGVLHSGLLALGSNVPFVVTGHGSDVYDLPWRHPTLTKWARRVVQEAAAVVGVSDFICKHLSALGARNTRRIFNGADASVFAPQDRNEAKRALRIDNGPVIAFVGDIAEHKGIPSLIEAMRSLRELQPQVLLAGAGSMEREAAQAFTSMGVQARFFGVVPQSSIARLFGAADLVVLPSRREGLPAVLCEAMLAGRAIVARDVGGVAEIVRDDETGYLVRSDDPSELAARMRDVLASATLRERFEDSARHFALEQLTWSSNAREYVGIYHDVLLSTRDSAGSQKSRS